MSRTYMMYSLNGVNKLFTRDGPIHTYNGWAMVEVPSHYLGDPTTYKIQLVYRANLAIKVTIDDTGCVGHIVKDRYNGVPSGPLSYSSIETITSGALTHFGIPKNTQPFNRGSTDFIHDNDISCMYDHLVSLAHVDVKHLPEPSVKMDVLKMRQIGAEMTHEMTYSNLCGEIFLRNCSGDWVVEPTTDVSVKLSQLM